MSTGVAWTALTARVSAETFNGVEGARFEYGTGRAYVSAAFEDGSDDLYLTIQNAAGADMGEFLSVAAYYDNRDGGVVDDLG